MKRKNSAFEKISSGKGFYITAAIAFCAIIASVIAAYYSSNRLVQKPQANQIETSDHSIPAEVNKTDIPDERDIETEPMTEIEPTTTMATTAPTTNSATTQIAETTGEQFVNLEFVLPCGGDIIKKYSPSEPIYSKTMGDWRIHNGIDFAVEAGDEVYSVGNGKVSKVIADPKWGYVIEVDYGFFTGRYCGIKQDTAVGIDKTVKTGDVIGEIDNIPIEAEDGAHLHFETLKNGKNVDPFTAMGK